MKMSDAHTMRHQRNGGTIDMSVRQTFEENEDLFVAESQQRSGVTRYLVRNTQTGDRFDASSIYVQPNDRQIHITVSALEHDRFPNSPRLHDFLRDNARIAGRPGHSRHRYELQERHIRRMIGILRQV